MTDVQKTIIGLLLLVATTFFVYSFSVNGSFKTMDDDYSIVRNENIRSFRNIPKIMTSAFFGDESYYRPLVTISFMKEYHFFKLNPFAYYIDNIVIHILNAFWVFAIVFSLTARREIALGSAFVFALHPIQWEAVSNIPGRAIILCAFYGFACIYFFINADSKKYFSYLSLIAFALALLCKESAGVLPLVLLSYIFFIKRKESFTIPKLFTTFVPYAAVVAVYLWVRHTLGITKTFPWRSANELALGFLSFLRSVITDFRLFVYPVDLYFDRSRPIFVSFLNTDLILTVLFFCFLATALWIMRKSISRLQAFCISWFFIELLPVSQLVTTVGVQPGYISTAEHFLYTPSVGIFILAMLAFEYFQNVSIKQKNISGFMIRFGAIGFSLFLILMTIEYNIYSSNEVAMFERTLKINPSNTRIRNSLALSYAKHNRFDLAESNFRKVLEVEPMNNRARIGLGKSLCDQGKFWEGLREYDKVRDPGNLQTLLDGNVKSTLLFLVSRYDRLARTYPNDPRIFHSLGVIYSKLDDPKEAVVYYEKAIALDGNFKESLFNLASTYQMLGERDKAINLYERLLSLKSGPDELDRLSASHLADMARRGEKP